MQKLTPINNSPRLLYSLTGISILVAALSLTFAIISFNRSSYIPATKNDDPAWITTKSTRTLKVGVGAFPPYTMINASAEDPNERYTGYTIDMVRHIANSFDPPWKIEYHEINWDTLRADLYSGKCDFIANIMYLTIPRLPEFDFTRPFTYTSMGVGVVLANENRFEKFEDLNAPGVRISLVQGWTPTELARARLPKAELLIRPMDDPAAFQYQELAGARADVILQDSVTARLIERSHPGKVKLLWKENPPIRYACSFMLRKDNPELRDFLSNAIDAMLVDGTVEALDKKWKGLTDLEVRTFQPGSGVDPSPRAD